MRQPQNPVHAFVTTLLEPSSFISKHIREKRVVNAHLERDPMSEETRVSLRQFAKDCEEILKSAGYINVQLPELPILLTHCVPEMRTGKDESFRLLSSRVETLIFSEQADFLLNGLLKYVLVEQYRKPIDTVIAEVEAIIAYARLLAPIPLNTAGEVLVVNFRAGDIPDPVFLCSYLADADKRRRYYKAFQPHRKDSDAFGERSLLHPYGGEIERHQVTSMLDVLICKSNELRVHIPHKAETFGELREYMDLTLRTERANKSRLLPPRIWTLLR